MVTALGMVDWKALAFHLRATRFDAIIVASTAIAAVGISIEFCILIGVFASFLLAVPRAGRITRSEFVVCQDGVVRERKEGQEANPRLLIFGLEGELFFASSLALDEHLGWFERRVSSGADAMVLRVKRLRHPDAFGMRELERFIECMQKANVRIFLAGVPVELLAGLRQTGALKSLDAGQVFPERSAEGSSTMAAILAARDYLERLHPEEASRRPPGPAYFEV
jgi:SulP family sulfate permease